MNISPATKFRIEFTVFGGPHDGFICTYRGEFLSSESLGNVLAKMDALVAEGHRYKILDFDENTMTGKLMW